MEAPLKSRITTETLRTRRGRRTFVGEFGNSSFPIGPSAVAGVEGVETKVDANAVMIMADKLLRDMGALSFGWRGLVQRKKVCGIEHSVAVHVCVAVERPV